MRKTTAAVLAATLAASGGALAQSYTTLYGIVDVGLQWNRQYAAPAQQSTWSIDSGYQSGRRLGFRGAEKLLGGTSAIFTLEAGFDTSTGQSTQGGTLFGRQAWVGLQGDWGTLVGGRIPTPSSGTGAYDMFAAVDPFGAGFGINQVGTTFVAANALREDNAALYVTPVLAGFKGAAGYSFNRGGAETAPQGSNSPAMTFAASWSGGQFYVVATYDVLAYPDAGFSSSNAGKPDEKLLQIGATYDFKVVKLHAAWADQRNISATRAGVSVPPPAGLTAYDNQAWMLGASIPLAGGSLMMSYQSSAGDGVSYASPNGIAYFDPDYNVWGVAFTYPFSSRTNLYLGYGQVSAKGSLDPTLYDRQQSAFGVRHRF